MRDPIYSDFDKYDAQGEKEDAYEAACALRARDVVEKDPIEYIECLGPIYRQDLNDWLVKQMIAGNLPDKLKEALVDVITEDLIYDKQHRGDWELGRGDYDIT
jgi:hypothetical protein